MLDVFVNSLRKEMGMPKAIRGFALMSPERLSEIAKKGGRSVPANKRSYHVKPELAREAGRKGGKSVNDKNRTFSRDRLKASKAGRLGGLASQKKKREAKEALKDLMQKPAVWETQVS